MIAKALAIYVGQQPRKRRTRPESLKQASERTVRRPL
jgi:hypothetical protein